jgi:hypothetical protein
MYRVFLIPPDEFAHKELWLDAHAVHETDCGEFWEFVDRDDHLVLHIAECSVRAFGVDPDRRKPRPAEEDLYPGDLRLGSRAGQPNSRPS